MSAIAGILVVGVVPGNAVVRIAKDRGGRIGTYFDKYQRVRNSGEMVVIDGLCASACTIVLGTIPSDHICVTPRAQLGFHAAWDMGRNGRAVTNPAATRMLYMMYPSPVRYWIASRGGLTPRMLFLQGKQLQAMYRPCTFNAQAAVRSAAMRAAAVRPMRPVAMRPVAVRPVGEVRPAVMQPSGVVRPAMMRPAPARPAVVRRVQPFTYRPAFPGTYPQYH